MAKPQRREAHDQAICVYLNIMYDKAVNPFSANYVYLEMYTLHTARYSSTPDC